MTGAEAAPGDSRRSRDAEGRPRNARPRDRLGRPLTPGSAGVEPVPDELNLSVAEAIDYAQRLLDEGRAFGAHEVLEAVWKSAPADERELWRSLAQLAVGITHLERGNLRGAAELSRRGAAGLGPYRGTRPYGLDIDVLADAGEKLAADILITRGPAVPRLRLRG